MMQQLETVHIDTNKRDSLVWKKSKDKKFYVNNCCKLLMRQTCYWEHNWPWKMIWKTKSPAKVAVFGWIVTWGVCLTQENLQRRGFLLANRCYLCEEDQESVEHLFLHCRISRQCWDLFLSICGISWAIPNSIRGLLECWQGQRIQKSLQQIWNTIPICIFWILWLERNRACFEGQRDHISRIKNKCLQNLFLWCKGSLIGSTNEYMDFLD